VISAPSLVWATFYCSAQCEDKAIRAAEKALGRKIKP